MEKTRNRCIKLTVFGFLQREGCSRSKDTSSSVSPFKYCKTSLTCLGIVLIIRRCIHTQYQREIYTELYYRSVNIDTDIPGYSILRCFQLSSEYRISKVFLDLSNFWKTNKDTNCEIQNMSDHFRRAHFIRILWFSTRRMYRLLHFKAVREMWWKNQKSWIENWSWSCVNITADFWQHYWNLSRDKEFYKTFKAQFNSR